MLMSGTLARFQPEHLLEWGTHVGKSARVFYETDRTFRINCTIHTIDLPENSYHIEHPGRRYGKFIRHLSKIQKYRGDGLEVSLRLGCSLPVGTRLMFFLDGDHSYSSVLRELDAIIHVFPQACILIHDTFFQSAGSEYNIGPYQAIQEVLKTNSENFQVIHLNTGLPGMTLLYPK
jgi:cephalosporin hydroxylase